MVSTWPGNRRDICPERTGNQIKSPEATIHTRQALQRTKYSGVFGKMREVTFQYSRTDKLHLTALAKWCTKPLPGRRNPNVRRPFSRGGRSTAVVPYGHEKKRVHRPHATEPPGQRHTQMSASARCGGIKIRSTSTTRHADFTKSIEITHPLCR